MRIIDPEMKKIEKPKEEKTLPTVAGTLNCVTIRKAVTLMSAR